MLHGVCIKLKCNKHSDWSSMRMDQLKQQMRSLESHKVRLDLLVKTRQRQLHIQYYEQLLLLQQQQSKQQQQEAQPEPSIALIQ